MNKPPFGLHLVLAASTLAGLLLVSNAQAANLLYDYNFNDGAPGSTTSTASTGSLTTSGTFRAIGTPSRGAAGSGVSGAAGDLAFDNTDSSFGVTSGGLAGYVSVANTAGSFNSISSFTLSGWYQIPTTVTGAYGNSNIFNKSQSNTASEGRLWLTTNRDANGTARLGLVLDENTFVYSSYNATLGATGQWTYFAATYNGTLASNNLSFYVGTTTTSVSLVNTTTLNLGTTAASNNAIAYLGANSAGNQGFGGLLDNIRLFVNDAGVGNQATGALSLSQLESYRSLDVVPEPSVIGLAFVGLGALLAFRRQRNR